MSIRDLAVKANCSIGLISKIELNRVSPTIRTLEKLCKAMDVTLSDFLRLPAPNVIEAKRIERAREECPLVMKWSGARMLQLIPAADTTFTSLVLQLEPGSGTSPRHSLFSHIQICFVLRGTVQLEIDDTKQQLTETEGVYFNTLVDHLWHNTGDEPAEVLIFNPYAFTLFEQKQENLRWDLHLKKERKREKQLVSHPHAKN